MIKKLLITSILILISNGVHAKRLHHEKYYQERECTGIVEYKLDDNTRVDCLTSEYAIEDDFANKWAEAIGQSLHYARKTGLKAGIHFIIEKESDMKHYKKLMDNINFYKLPIMVWVIKEY